MHLSACPQVNLMTADLKPLAERLVSAQGIENVILAMRAQPASQHIQTQGSVVLRLLAMSDAGRARALKAGAVPAVADAMRRHAAVGDLQQHCCMAMLELCAIEARVCRGVGGRKTRSRGSPS